MNVGMALGRIEVKGIMERTGMNMTHLTTKQVLQMIDGTLDYAGQAQCTSHLAVCERCRYEMEFQKAVAKAARHQPVVNTSAGFVRRVMLQIVPERRKSWKTRLVDNLGNVLAMGVVLAILGYAISSPSVFQAQEQSSQQSFIPQAVSETYAKFVQSIAQRANDATKQIATSTGNEGTKMIALTILSLLILVGIDQFVLKKHSGIKTKP
jgi:anti-sigma factor RsiW